MQPSPEDKMDTFHQLVAAERYREARGILEAEADIPPEVARKWHDWLNDLHHDERLQAGVMADLKKRDPARALDQVSKATGGMLVVMVVGMVIWVIVAHIFTYATANQVNGGVFLLLALVMGYLGWQRAAHFISPRHSFPVGAVISFGLLVFLLTSGIPVWYHYEPPLRYLLAAFALIFPACAWVGYRIGEYLGLGVLSLARRLLGHPAEAGK